MYGYAVCAELPAGDDPPEWLPLIPAGERFQGRDGRTFRSPGAAQILTAQRANSAMIPVDINHSEVAKAPQGEPSPAVGWIEAFEERNGAVWGRVSWNTEGAELIARKAYRYYSPTFLIDRNAEVRIVHSVGLVNKPNLLVPALNREEPMDLKKIAEALGLSANATEAEILAAIAKRPAPNASGEIEMVPKADYDVVMNRAETAEQKLAERDESDLKAEASAAVDGAVKNRKIAPASKGYYLSLCTTREGLDNFKKFAESAPKVIDDQAAAPEGKAPDGGTRLSPEAEEVARQMNVDEVIANAESRKGNKKE